MSQKDFNRARTVVMNALLEDAEIQAFVQEHFHRRLLVYREIDPNNLPDDSKCPFIGFGPFTHGQARNNQHAIEHAMPIGVFIGRACKYEKTGNGGYILPASDELDELAGMAERIASTALLSAGFAFDQDEAAEPDGVDWSHYFYCFYTYRVRTTRHITV